MSKGVILFWTISIVLAVARVAFTFMAHPPDIAACLRRQVEGQGRVSAEPERKDTGQVLQVHVEQWVSGDMSCPVDITIRIKTPLYPRFSYGQEIQFVGTLSSPRNFVGGTGRSFDYAGYLAKDDIYVEMKSAKAYEVGSTTVTMRSILYDLKHTFVSNIGRALGEPHAALASGLVVGEKAALGKDLLDDFRRVGLIHIIVLSGYNITIVGEALRRLLSRLPRVWGIVVGGAGIGLFGVLVGGGATVVRSCVMAGVALFADFIRRDYQVARALAFAALVMIIVSPMILFHDPSFQLSFLATLGLVLFASPIEARLQWIPDRFGIRGIVASTIATQITVSPYILYMMGQLSIIGMAVNILVLPIIPLTMLFVFLTGVVGFVSYHASLIIGWVAHVLLSYELAVVGISAKAPFAAIELPPFSWQWVICFYATVAVVVLWRWSRAIPVPPADCSR